MGSGRSFACPFARCADVKFDKDLGVLTRNDTPVQAVRLFGIIQAPEDDEVVAAPDPTNRGFRVSENVKCAVAVEALRAILYEIKNRWASYYRPVAYDRFS